MGSLPAKRIITSCVNWRSSLFLSYLIYGIITLNNTGHSGNTIYRTDNGNSSCDKYFTEMRYNLTDEVDLIMCLLKRNSNE